MHAGALSKILGVLYGQTYTRMNPCIIPIETHIYLRNKFDFLEGPLNREYFGSLVK